MVTFSLYSCFFVSLFILASFHSCDAIVFRPNETIGSMRVLSHVPYLNSDSQCDRLNQPCAPLNDCWGASIGTKEYAFVGLSNGVDFLDVTDPSKPTQTSHSAFIPGCITEWRDIKSHQNAVYVVNDEVAFCTCEAQPCQFQVIITGMEPSIPSHIDGILGKMGPALTTDIEGLLRVPTSPIANASFGCNVTAWDGIPSSDHQWIGLVDRGICSISAKVRAAQAAGALALIVISYRDDEIFPSMSGNKTGIDIPVVMIAHNDGETVRSQLQSHSLYANLSSSSYVYDPLFKPPEGLWLIDFSNPADPLLVTKNRDYFDFAHNILVDPQRNLLYVCGMDTNEGGIIVFKIDDPLQPVFIKAWSEAYIHDVQVAYRDDLKRWILYGTAIYDSQVFMLDVNDPSSATFLTTIVNWSTPDWPHNTASTPDGKVVYLTHEDFAMPISIWHVESTQDITQAGQFSIQSDLDTIPHNIFLKDNRLWASYYSSGIAAFGIADPLHPTLIATNNSMVDPRYGPGAGYHGVWGIYPFSSHPSGSITYASDIETGFWILDMVIPQPQESGISAFGVIAIIVVILVILGGCFFVFRYMKNNNISISGLFSKTKSSWGSKDHDESHERLALDEEEEDDGYYYKAEI